jgi:6-phosphogluconolactonase
MNRRNLLKSGALLALGSSVLAEGVTNKKYFIGGGSGSQAGIHLYELDEKSGLMTEKSIVGANEDHGFQCVNKGLVYSCLSVGKGKKAQALVKAYKFDALKLSLVEVSSIKTESRLCHVEVHGNLLVGVSYGAAYLEVFDLDDTGKIKGSQEVFRFEGGSVNPQRQKSSHPHCFKFDAKGEFGFMPDLGRDLIEVFQVKNGRLVKREDLSYKSKPGAGPRHFTFHPDDQRAYLINELDFTITAFNYKSGQLSATHTVPTKPESFTEWNSCADIHVHPSGRFIYGSNRGHNSIVSFEIKGDKLTWLGYESTRGDIPRNFGIYEDFALVANQKSNDIQFFELNQQTGKLNHKSAIKGISGPSCVNLL